MSKPSYPTQAELWAMDPYSFNEWRANNDIPALFARFATLLPGFGDWVNSLPFDKEVMMQMVPTGELFKGESEKIAINRPGDQEGQRFIECCNATEFHGKFGKYSDAIIYGTFRPYFLWARINLGRNRFFSYELSNTLRTDTFSYNRRSGLNPMRATTRTYLFFDIPVLKLGQCKLPDDVIMLSRNLDFTDLDFLSVTAELHGWYSGHVNYSSCRGIRFENARASCCTFYQCVMKDFTASYSNLQDLHFEKCEMGDFYMKSCFAYKIGFRDSNVRPFLQDCELREINYIPPKDAQSDQVAQTFRLLRVAFQSSGMRREASECYFRERVYERKAAFRPYELPENRGVFPDVPYGGSIYAMQAKIEQGLLSSADRPSMVTSIIATKLKMWLYPRYLMKLLPYKSRWFISFIESVLWGYGERPNRIIIFAFLTIAVYAVCYHGQTFNGGQILDKWTDSAYFSAVTFTTLGYGDIYPTSTLWKFVCASEALLGAFTMGLVVAGFSNRSLY
jgi:hypothetical protein